MNIAVKRWVQIMGCGVRGEEMGECETWVRLVCETCLVGETDVNTWRVVGGQFGGVFGDVFGGVFGKHVCSMLLGFKGVINVPY